MIALLALSAAALAARVLASRNDLCASDLAMYRSKIVPDVIPEFEGQYTVHITWTDAHGKDVSLEYPGQELTMARESAACLIERCSHLSLQRRRTCRSLRSRVTIRSRRPRSWLRS